VAVSIDLSDAAVLVTGGTKGIGYGIVEGMLKAGARVAFCAPDESECSAVSRDLAARYTTDHVLGVQGDLRSRDSLTTLVHRTIEHFGRIDTLICNAAEFGVHSSLEDMDCEVFARILQSNVVNNLHLCRLVLPQMEHRGSGCITLITSIAGHVAMPTNIPYSSSKAALASMARSLAARYASSGVRINCISPGLIRSEASRDIWEDPEFLRKYSMEKIPMQRMGEPRDIAEMCVFLSSPFANYITGATIPVDGGRLGIGQSAGSVTQAQKAQLAGKPPNS